MRRASEFSLKSRRSISLIESSSSYSYCAFVVDTMSTAKRDLSSANEMSARNERLFSF